MIILFDRASWPLIRRITTNYVKPYVGWLAHAVVWMVLAAAMTAIFAQLVQPVLDHVLIARQRAYVLPMALAVLGCFALRGAATYLHTVLMNKIGQHIVSDVQGQLFRHLMGLDLAYFHAHPSGKLLSHMTADVAVMRTAVAEGLTNLGKNTLTLILLVGVMFWQDWRLALAAFIIFPMTAIFIATLGRRLRKLSHRTQESMATMSALLTQTFLGIRQVKAYGREEFEAQRMDKRAAEVRDLNIKNVRIGTLTAPVNDVLVGLTVFGLILYGGLQAVGGALSPGELMSFITAFLMSYEPMKRIAKLNNTLQVGFGAAQRIFEVLDTRPLVRKGGHAAPELKAASIKFDRVLFSYPDAGREALKALSFEAKGGEVTALVGPSGGGKSTIFNLLLRFYDPQAGAITLNGIAIDDIALSYLRRHVALVSQDVTIFDDTAAANIAYGRDDTVQADIEAAAKAANAHDFIMRLPQGYDTRLGENGVTLSGGQRQRIALARAFLRDAPILLLDEATSALDPESERLIQDSLARLQKGRTTLVIAHRLSTIRHASRILVIEQGQVVEQGTHDGLLAQGEAYAALVNASESDVLAA